MRKELANKPLVEAIFELKWELQESEDGSKIDPNYKILVGMLYAKLEKKYPYFEPLPAANMPDNLVPHMVLNRFRVDKDKWPVVQIGPGIITINDTENYKWEDFEQKVLEVINALVDTYSNFKENLIFNSLKLRYINTIDFNFKEENILSFLKNKMHTNVEIHSDLFNETGVADLPIGFDFKTSYQSTIPKGVIWLRFARGEINKTSKLALETMVISLNKDVPEDKDKIKQWISEAHTLTGDWFFKLIEGELLERFE